jgi:uncharacterized protein YegL
VLGVSSVAQQHTDYVVIVLDASGSMESSMRTENVQKMHAAKTALKEVLRQLPQSTQIGLLVFSAKNVRDEWIYPLGPRNDTTLMAAIDLPQPGGGTPLGSYMKKAADRLLEERDRNFGAGTYRMLVVTDGQAQDSELVDSYTPEIMSRGITVDVIGVAMKEDHTLATKAHSYRRADDAAGLKQAISEVFAEVGRSGTDTAAEAAFEVLAAIPNEIAMAMVQALSKMDNRPIGSGPLPRTQPSATGPATSSPSLPTGPPPASPPESKDGMPNYVLVFIVLLLIIMGLGRVSRKGRRR